MKFSEKYSKGNEIDNTGNYYIELKIKLISKELLTKMKLFALIIYYKIQISKSKFIYLIL
jgi:hypothetical protein